MCQHISTHTAILTNHWLARYDWEMGYFFEDTMTETLFEFRERSERSLDKESQNVAVLILGEEVCDNRLANPASVKQHQAGSARSDTSTTPSAKVATHDFPLGRTSIVIEDNWDLSCFAHFTTAAFFRSTRSSGWIFKICHHNDHMAKVYRRLQIVLEFSAYRQFVSPKFSKLFWVWRGAKKAV